MNSRLLRVALPLSLVSLGLLAQAAAARAFRGFVGYRSPFVFANPGAAAGPAHSESVVVVLLDGLGLDASRELPFLNQLRARGADFACGVGVPRARGRR
jgi:hypothetical protein